MLPLALATMLPAAVQDDAAAPNRAVRLHGLLERTLEESGLPGLSVAVLLPDARVTGAVGHASVDDEEPLTPEHRFLAGSAGKTFVAAAAVRLASRGELDLDRRAADWLAEAEGFRDLPNADAYTLRQLLRHESGLPRYVFAPELWESLRTEPERVWDAAELVAFVAGAEPLFAPGEGWAYSDTNYLVVGRVLEAVTGEPFPAHARRVFVEPLGLADTVAQEGPRIPGVAQGHVVAGRSMGLPARARADDARGGAFVFNVQFEGCGGGWASTPSDLAEWARHLWGGGLFEGEDLAALLDAVPAPALGPGRAYGLGTIVTPTELGPMHGHDGFMPGYLTVVGWFPDHDLAVALQANGDDPSALGRPLYSVAVDLARAVLEMAETEAGR